MGRYFLDHGHTVYQKFDDLSIKMLSMDIKLLLVYNHVVNYLNYSILLSSVYTKIKIKI